MDQQRRAMPRAQPRPLAARNTRSALAAARDVRARPDTGHAVALAAEGARRRTLPAYGRWPTTTMRAASRRPFAERAGALCTAGRLRASFNGRRAIAEIAQGLTGGGRAYAAHILLVTLDV